MATTRKQFTDQQRAQMLAVMKRKGLTGKQAAKKFGVHEVTIWKWKQAARRASTSRARPRLVGDGALTSMIRSEVHERLQKSLPVLVREEINRALRSLR